MTSARQAHPDPFGLPEGWWPVAHGDEVGHHPAAFRLGDQDLALYRDLRGVARAVEDRCPHRRLPLSMGRLTEDGSIQCPYHGWSFDGETGRCTAIPNLSEHERIPAGIKVAAFSAVENVAEAMGYGFRSAMLAPPVGPPTGEEPDEGTTMYEAALAGDTIFVWTGSNAPVSRPPAGADHAAGAQRASGTLQIRSPHTDIADVLLFNPGSALGLGALLGSGDELCAPTVSVSGTGAEATVSVTRERLAYDLPRASTFQSLTKRVVTAQITTSAATGFTRIKVDGGRWLPSCEVTVALTPIGDYRTVLRWQIALNGGNGRAAIRAGARAWSAARQLSGRACDAAERHADKIADVVDPGVRALRDARSSAK